MASLQGRPSPGIAILAGVDLTGLEWKGTQTILLILLRGGRELKAMLRCTLWLAA